MAINAALPLEAHFRHSFPELMWGRGVHHRGNVARCVFKISGGREKSLEILYNVMQRPVGLQRC